MSGLLRVRRIITSDENKYFRAFQQVRTMPMGPSRSKFYISTLQSDVPSDIIQINLIPPCSSSVPHNRVHQIADRDEELALSHMGYSNMSTPILFPP